LEHIIQNLSLCSEEDFIENANRFSSSPWIWPKTDLYHWVKVLNRMDFAYDLIVKKYHLPVQSQSLEKEDIQLLIANLSLTRVLWDNATNRTLYNSYEVPMINVAYLQSFISQ
jgi:hypothetical protein